MLRQDPERISLQRPQEEDSMVLVDLDKDTFAMLQMLRQADETQNDVLMRLIIQFVITDPNMPQVFLSEKGKRILYGDFNRDYV